MVGALLPSTLWCTLHTGRLGDVAVLHVVDMAEPVQALLSEEGNKFDMPASFRMSVFAMWFLHEITRI